MDRREYYELRSYELLSRNHVSRLDQFLRDAALPAYSRLGIRPIGVFTGVYGVRSAVVHVLIPHTSIESVVKSRDTLLEDKQYLEAGRDFLETHLGEPAYARIESSLLRSFSHMPVTELPDPASRPESRIFELRVYESHSLLAGKRKIEMFNEGGEIDLFRKKGLRPVLFGETIVGTRMPNLAYLLTFEDMQERDAVWQRFLSDPDWIKLRDAPYYKDKDTVSSITDLILRPTTYSQM